MPSEPLTCAIIVVHGAYTQLPAVFSWIRFSTVAALTLFCTRSVLAIAQFHGFVSGLNGTHSDSASQRPMVELQSWLVEQVPQEMVLQPSNKSPQLRPAQVFVGVHVVVVSHFPLTHVPAVQLPQFRFSVGLQPSLVIPHSTPRCAQVWVVHVPAHLPVASHT
jgi:hypothetical protein